MKLFDNAAFSSILSESLKMVCLFHVSHAKQIY